MTAHSLLVLCKRRYMSKDLLDDRYGRFWEIPLELARAGLAVCGICLDYRSAAGVRRHATGEVQWASVGAGHPAAWSGSAYRRAPEQVCGGRVPDTIWACSDAIHAVIGARLATRLGARLVIDLYDNFEGYPLARLPFANRALQWALARADAVTCVSQPLQGLVRQRVAATTPVLVVENAVDAGVFRPHERLQARRRFGLPADARIIGTVGALHRSRGIQALYSAFESLGRTHPELHLLLAGPRDHGARPQGDRVHDFGQVAHAEVPMLLAALDVAVICNLDSAFGRYCFPQKFYEMVACGVPLVAARVGALAELLAGRPDALFEPGDGEDLAGKLAACLREPRPIGLAVPEWRGQALRVAALLEELAAAPRHRIS